MALARFKDLCIDACDPAALGPITEAGATTLLARGDDRRWDVLADPEGNELCVFVRGRDV